MNALTKNPQTTVGGMIGIAIAALVILRAIVSGESLTSEEIMLAMATLGNGYAALMARQSNRSSEDVGAK